MGIYKRGSVWWMSFMVDGQRIRRSTETEDRKLAQRIFDKLKGEIAERKWFDYVEGQDVTFKELMDRYMAEYSAVHKKPRSYERDISLNKHLQGFFGDEFLTEITPKMIAEYKVKRREEGASPRSLNYELVLMGHAFNLAMKEWELVNDNPVRKVAKEKVRNQVERWLTAEEEKRLLAAAPAWLQEIILFAIHTGFRQSEILDLKWSQVDLTRRTVTILEQKNGSVDTLPMNQTAMSILMKRLAAKSEGCDYVFPSRNGKRIMKRNLFRAFQEATVKAEIAHFRFHDLRHTFATRLVQNGVDLYTVQKLGRWKHTAMVGRYAHHFTESLRPGIEAIDEAKNENVTYLAQPQKIRGHKPSLRLVTP